VVDLPGDVLIVPQPTLCGKVKGKVLQYHRSIGKADGKPLYDEFVTACRKSLDKNLKCLAAKKVVCYSTYGVRPAISIQSNGPDTHLIEI
jgi:D-Tyr-tRNAtyr deacylase